MKEFVVFFSALAVFAMFSAKEIPRDIKKKMTAAQYFSAGIAAVVCAVGALLPFEALYAAAVLLWMMYTAVYMSVSPKNFKRKAGIFSFLIPSVLSVMYTGVREHIFFANVFVFGVILFVSAAAYRQLRAAKINIIVPAVFAAWPFVFIYRMFFAEFSVIVSSAVIAAAAVVFNLYISRGIDYYIEGKRFYNTAAVIYALIMIQGFVVVMTYKNPLFLYLAV
ncbi:MAG TPA: hypothetical protein ENN55_04230 [Firmicutes bacterium]|nr:hypothetical protein [Bacillota bacterium]